MIAFLGLLEEQYGGVECYLGKNLGFSTEDITVIQRNLVFGAEV
jgi:Tyrosine phosphatase family